MGLSTIFEKNCTQTQVDMYNTTFYIFQIKLNVMIESE